MPKTRDTAFAARLGETLRSNRHLAGLSQEAMGDALDVTFQQIQKYEKGRSRLTVEQLVKWARACNVATKRLIPDALHR